MQFIDVCVLTLKSGNGGHGALAWRREAHVTYGGPFGGNGGDGGNIYLRANNNVNTLFHLRNLKKLTAKNGENGASKIQHGAKAVDLYVDVPCGTIVTELTTGKKICDLVYHDQTYLLCVGGKGGKGNFYFKSSVNQAPSLWERGDLGEQKVVKLELQSIADVGLVGLPNVGKSSLLRAISNAKPKVASYPFTTLTPVLGTVEHKRKKLVFADIPGLVENASLNYGLGHDFLKHLNRCHVLLHLISLNPEHSENNLLDQFQIIDQELQKFSTTLYHKPRIFVFSMCDLEYDQTALQKFLAEFSFPVFVISSKTSTGLAELLDYVFEQVQTHQNQLDDQIFKIELTSLSSTKNDPTIQVQKSKYGWTVQNLQLAYWIHKIPQNTIDNKWRLKQKMAKLQITEALLQAGAQKGDQVQAYGLNWSFLDNSD